MEMNKVIPNSKPGEEIILTLRRHWITLSLIFVKLIFAAVLPIVFIYVVNLSNPTVFNSMLVYTLTILSMSIYLMFIWLFFFNNFLDYYLDVWIVSSERIINIEQRNLFFRSVSEKNLDRMQDITSEVKGFLPTFLNYGNIYIQTAGTQERFVFKDVPNAPEVTQEIIKIVQEYKQRHGLSSLDEENNKKIDRLVY